MSVDPRNIVIPKCSTHVATEKPVPFLSSDENHGPTMAPNVRKINDEEVREKKKKKKNQAAEPISRP